MYNHEIHSLRFGKSAEMVSYMYSLPEGTHYKRGYKAPNDIRTPVALDLLRRYWPKTALIIGLRHPVKWFQSFYNFNMRQHDGAPGGKELPPAEMMVGAKLPDHFRYHNHLALLGNTNVTDPEEMKLLGSTGKTVVQPLMMTNPVFLFEVSQPFDERDGRDEQYRKDLSDFIGLSVPLSPIPKEEGRTSRNYNYAIDICDEKYRSLREELLEVGTNAATWIRSYFMTLPDVMVSSPEHMHELLSSWSVDPCDDEEKRR